MAKAIGIPLVTHVIGPRRALSDLEGSWARAREITDSGCVLVRPDHHVAWRAEEMVADPAAELSRVLSAILDRDSLAQRNAAE